MPIISRDNLNLPIIMVAKSIVFLYRTFKFGLLLKLHIYWKRSNLTQRFRVQDR